MSVLAWLVANWKNIGFIALCLVLGAFWGLHSYKTANLEKAAQKWQERALNAEADADALRKEKDALKTALDLQEKAAAEALAKRKVVYRTVQKEVARDENARDWYNSPVSDSLMRIVRQGGASGDD